MAEKLKDAIKAAKDLAEGLEEWAVMLKGTAQYSQQEIVRTFGDIPGTLRRKLTEAVDQFADNKNIEDNRYKKVAHRIADALTSRDINSAIRALRDLLPK